MQRGFSRTGVRLRQQTLNALRMLSARIPQSISREILRSFSSARPTLQDAKFTHIDSSGKPSMVDVSSKDETTRSATAIGRIYVPAVAYSLVTDRPDDAEAREDEANGDLRKLKEKARKKGDVLVTAQLAGIMAAKRTPDIIPLCHQIPLSHISVSLSAHTSSNQDNAQGDATSRSQADPSKCKEYFIEAQSTVRCHGKTGVEMEALTAVSASLLTVWDMLKAVAGKEMVIGDIYVSHKSGGRSGDFTRSRLGD